MPSSELLISQKETIILEPNRTHYLLSATPVIGTAEIEGWKYGWHVEGNEFIVDSIPIDSSQLRIRYMVLNKALPSIQIHDEKQNSRFSLGDSINYSKTQSANNQLDVTGAKTFTVSISEKGKSSLEQGLSIDASGKLGDVNVKANLTDEQGSFMPEGTTERIDEFDRISIKLSKNTWTLNLGDIDFSYPISGYGKLQRRIQGAYGELNTGSFRIRTAAGIDGTRHGNLTLKLKDGKHGPYKIGNTASGHPLVPGSEKIRLDNKLLKRGYGEDYVIDYQSGELTLNNSLRFDANSRIEVDYTYAGTDYRTNNQLAGLGWGPLDIFFYREADSPNHLFHTWSKEQQAILDSISGYKASLPGGTPVADGQGSYILIDNHYVWVGQGAGNYQVSFRRVADSLGDYVLDADSGFFRYIGNKSGNYRAEILTTLPHREETAGLSFLKEQGPFIITAIAIGSRITPNIYNPLRQHYAHTHQLGLGFTRKHFNINVSHLFQTDNLWLPANDSSQFLAERWFLDSLSGKLNQQVLQIIIKPLDSLFVKIEGGHLWLQENRYRTALYSRAPFFDLSFDYLQKRQRGKLELHPVFGIFIPKLGFSFKNYPNVKTRNYEPMLGLSLSPFTKLVISSTVSRRVDQKNSGQWQDSVYYDKLLTHANWDGDKLLANVTAGIERYAFQEGGKNWQAFYGDACIDYSPSSHFKISAQASQQLTQEKTSLVYYLPVKPGTGNYTRDPETGEYIPAKEGSGDYKKVVEHGESENFINERNASLSGYLSLNKLNLWTSTSYHTNGAFHSILSSLRITMLPGNAALSIIVYPSYKNQIYPRWNKSMELKRSWETSAELRSQIITDYTLRLKGNYHNEVQKLNTNPLRSKQTWEIKLAPIINTWLQLEPELGFGNLLAYEPRYYPNLGGINITEVWIGLNAQKRYKKWLLKAGFNISSRQSKLAADKIPYQIKLDNPIGIHPSWNIEAEHSFVLETLKSNTLNLRVKYEGNYYPDNRGLTNRFQFSAGLYF